MPVTQDVHQLHLQDFLCFQNGGQEEDSLVKTAKMLQ